MIVQFGIKKSTLTADEKEFLRKYNALDESGKRMIRTMISRCTSERKERDGRGEGRENGKY